MYKIKFSYVDRDSAVIVSCNCITKFCFYFRIYDNDRSCIRLKTAYILLSSFDTSLRFGNIKKERCNYIIIDPRCIDETYWSVMFGIMGCNKNKETVIKIKIKAKYFN